MITVMTEEVLGNLYVQLRLVEVVILVMEKIVFYSK